MNNFLLRAAGLTATIFAGLSVMMAPLNALARMRTTDALSDFENPLASWWARPAMRAASPLVEWGYPDKVYEIYGKFYVFALLAVLACAIAVRSRRGTAGMGLAERWGWRISLPSYALLATSLFITYWVANLDVVFLLVTLPTMLLNTIGELLLGIGLIRSKFRPRLTGWLLALGFPLSQGLIAISTQRWVCGPPCSLGVWRAGHCGGPRPARACRCRGPPSRREVARSGTPGSRLVRVYLRAACPTAADKKMEKLLNDNYHT